jgi:hypothetical protein
VAAAAVTVTGLAVTVIVVSSASSTSSDRAAPAAPIPALDAVADAAVDRVPVPGAGVEAPPDAGVAPLARDAAVARVEARDRPPAASSPAAASRPAGGSAASAAPAARRPTTPPPAPGTPLSAAHLAALRVAIRDAGYRGVTLAELDKDLDGTARSFQEDLDKRLADGEDHTLWLLVDRTMLGAVARRRGDCKTAEARFAEALRSGPSTLPDSPDRDKGFLWYGRAHLGKALCRLAAGDLAGADKAFKNAAMIGWGGGGRLELADADLGWGILHYERGDLDGARSILRRTGRGGDAPLRAALEAWLTAVDWDLREPYHPLLGLDGKPVGSERTAGTP